MGLRIRHYKENDEYTLGSGFGAEHALESRPCKPYADQFLAVPLRIVHMHDLALRGEVGFPAPRSVV